VILTFATPTPLEVVRREVSSAVPYRIDDHGDRYFVVRKGFMVAATVARLPSGETSVEGTFGTASEAILALVISLVGLILIPRLWFMLVVFPKQQELAAAVGEAIAARLNGRLAS
jgi:hypothetical protein